MTQTIDKLEKELNKLNLQVGLEKPKRGSIAYQLMLNRQNRIMGGLAALRGEVV